MCRVGDVSIVAKMSGKTWEDLFYELAETFVESESLLLFLGGKMKLSRAELITKCEKELSQSQRNNLTVEARKTVGDLVKKKDDPRFLNDKRKFERTQELQRMLDQRRNDKGKLAKQLLDRIVEVEGRAFGSGDYEL